MAGQHASYGPSSSERVTTCPASYRETAGMPDQPNVYAMLGTVAHEIHERCLKEGVLATTYLGEVFTLTEGEGEFELTETFVVDEEMCEAVQASVDRINDRVSDLMFESERVELHVEQKIDITPWTPIPDQFGTSDTYLVADETLDVFDYKHGEGKKVFAEKNTQGALYALGVLNALSKPWTKQHPAAALPWQTVRIHIHQPRLDHFDTWEVPLKELLGFGDWIRDRFALTVIDNPPFGPSESGCMFCKKKATCKARAEMVAKLVDEDFEDESSFADMTIASNEPPGFEFMTPRSPAMFDADQLAFVRRYTRFVKKWADDIEAEVERRLLHREAVGDWKLVEGRGSREWASEDEARAAMLAAGIPAEKHYKTELLTPPAAEEQIKGRGKRARVKQMEPFVRRIKGPPTVASGRDPRAPYDLLADGFEDLTDDGLSVPSDDGLSL